MLQIINFDNGPVLYTHPGGRRGRDPMPFMAVGFTTTYACNQWQCLSQLM